MWAQLITTRLKPGKEDGLRTLVEQLQAAEQPDTGLVRSTTMRDQNDPLKVCTMVVFDSEESARAREESARAREDDPRRAEGLQAARATMAEIFAEPLTFTDLLVVSESTH
jgi:quinol monooxygenase YgiN